MAGKGTRLSKIGNCKPAIKVCGRAICQWCLQSISKHLLKGDHLIVITTEYFEINYSIKKLISDSISYLNLDIDFDLILAKNTPPGPAATVSYAKSYIKNKEKTTIVNCDQFCDFKFPEVGKEWDAFIPITFNSNGSSSYVKLKKNKIIQIAEKKMISNYASIGVYGFNNPDILFSLIQDALNGPAHYKNEYFVAPIFEKLISSNKIILPTETYAKYDLGNIEGINNFKKTFNNFEFEK